LVRQGLLGELVNVAYMGYVGETDSF
jgi:hypothetical protein